MSQVVFLQLGVPCAANGGAGADDVAVVVATSEGSPGVSLVLPLPRFSFSHLSLHCGFQGGGPAIRLEVFWARSRCVSVRSAFVVSSTSNSTVPPPQAAQDRIKSFLTSGLMSFDSQAFRVTLEEERLMGIADPGERA